MDTLLGEEPSLTPGTEPLQANNQTLATGDSGGDTEQLVSSIVSSSSNISSLELQSPPQPSAPPNILALTATYFLLNFLAATQDVAVDG